VKVACFALEPGGGMWPEAEATALVAGGLFWYFRAQWWPK